MTDPSQTRWNLAKAAASPDSVPLRLLLVEDSEEDAFFILRHLRGGGREISSERVDTLGGVAAALEGGRWDAVISDWSLPGFDAMDVLESVRKRDPETPFIIVSGTIGEEKAVEAMKAGAHDYVPKSNLVRLPSAIQREVEGARGGRAEKRTEEKYRSIFENAVEGIFQTTMEGRPVTANPAMARILGYSSPEELISSVTDIAQVYVDRVGRREFSELIRRHGVVSGFETRLLCKGGSFVWTSVNAYALYDEVGELAGFEGMVEDITERKKAEKALERSEKQFRATFEQAAVGMAHVGPLGKFLRVNDRLCEIVGYSRAELMEQDFQSITYPKDLDADLEQVERMLAGVISTYSIEKRYVRKDGPVVWVDLTVSLVREDADTEPSYFISVVEDITERKKAEEKLRHALDVLLALYEAGHMLGSTLDLDEVGPGLLEIMQRVSNLSAAVILVRDEARKWHPWHTIGTEDLWESARRTPEAVAARFMALKTEEHRTFELSRTGTEPLVGLCLPLRMRDRVVGVLEAYGSQDLIEKETVEILGGLASQAASALENARLYEELIERESRLHDLVGRLLGAQEEERRRVAYEVHDGLAQVAAAPTSTFRRSPTAIPRRGRKAART